MTIQITSFVIVKSAVLHNCHQTTVHYLQEVAAKTILKSVVRKLHRCKLDLHQFKLNNHYL